MNTESSIRSRIEAVLLHDARRYAELKQDLGEEGPLWMPPLAHERGLYERIIASCRHTLSEVNGLLEENIEFLSGLCRIIEGIRDKTDLEEICVQMAASALQDFRAEYCAIVLFDDASCGGERFCLEAVREDHSILRVHSTQSLLGSPRLEAALRRFVFENPQESLSSPDVYRDVRFEDVDWPSVVRSLACVPVVSCGNSVGALVLAHSIPSSFRDNQFRLLKILAGMIAHARLLTSGRHADRPTAMPVAQNQPDHFSVVLFSFENSSGHGRGNPPDPATLRELRRVLAGALEVSEPILPHGETGFMALLPGTGSDLVSGKVRALREAFKTWVARQENGHCRLRMNLGFATCRPGEDLSRILEAASAVIQSESDE